MKIDNGNTSASTSGAAARSLGIPRHMTLTAVCRGALGEWPQLADAIPALLDEHAFLNLLARRDSGADRLSFGGPRQLLDTLAVQPAWLHMAAPPPDLYAWFLWLALRAHQAARTTALTLEYVPDMLAQAQSSGATEAGDLIRQMLAGQSGLVQTAAGVAALAQNFAAHLDAHGAGHLEAACEAHEAAALALNKASARAESKGMAGMIATRRSASANASAIRGQLEEFEASAAKVTVLAVIENLAMAVRALAAGWKNAEHQFAGVAECSPEQLGDLAYLSDQLGLAGAASEWNAFADAVQGFVKDALVANLHRPSGTPPRPVLCAA